MMSVNSSSATSNNNQMNPGKQNTATKVVIPGVPTVPASDSNPHSSSHSFGPVKTLSAPSGSFLQPVPVSVNNPLAATGKNLFSSLKANAEKGQGMPGTNTADPLNNNEVPKENNTTLGPRRKPNKFS